MVTLAYYSGQTYHTACHTLFFVLHDFRIQLLGDMLCTFSNELPIVLDDDFLAATQISEIKSCIGESQGGTCLA